MKHSTNKIVSTKGSVSKKIIYMSKDGIKKTQKGQLVNFDDIITVDDAFEVIHTKGTDEDKLDLLVYFALRRKLRKNRNYK